MKKKKNKAGKEIFFKIILNSSVFVTLELFRLVLLRIKRSQVLGKVNREDDLTKEIYAWSNTIR